MQQEDSKLQKKRPRAKTGGPIPNIIKGRPSAPVTTTPLAQDESSSSSIAHLSVDELLSSLTPPAVLSLNHARALHTALRKETPPLATLIPVVSRLCAPGTHAPFMVCGLDIITVYALSETRPPLTDIERASMFAIVRSSDLSWTLSKPRYNCLSALTKEGSCVAGFEDQFVRFSEECLGAAFEAVAVEEEDAERVQKDRYIECHSALLRDAFVKNAALYTEQHLHGTLQFYERFMQQPLDAILSPSSSEPVSIPSSPSVLHRRTGSSPQASLPYSGPRSHHAPEPTTPLDRTVLPCQMYLAFLEVLRPRLPLVEIPHVVYNLLRMVGAHITPLPHISASPLPQRYRPRPIEESALNHLFALLQGAFSATVASQIKTYLSSANKQVALGAFRTVRAVLRDAATSRMALLSLRRPKFDADNDAAPTGQMVLTEKYTRALERAHRENVEVPAFGLERLCRPAGRAIGEWLGRAGAEVVLEEAVGITVDIVDEACDRVEDNEADTNTSMVGPEEGRFIGTVLSETVKYIQRTRMSQKFSILPIDKPVSAPTSLLMKICRQLALPLSTPMTPSLPSILLSLTSHLTDAQTAPIPQNMYNLSLLTPTSPDWIDKITELFNALVQPNRPHTSREILLTIHTIHAELRGVPLYRRQLGYRICELIEESFGRDKRLHMASVEGDELLFHVSANELIWRIMETDQEEEDELVNVNDDSAQHTDLIERLLKMLVGFAKDPCLCCSAPPPLVADEATPPSSHEAVLSQSSLANSIVATPALSRVSSEMTSSATSDRETPAASSSGGGLMAMLPPWSISRNRDPEPSVSPVTTVRSSEVRTPSTPRSCRCFLAGVALVNVFQSISFSAPAYPAFSVQIYKSILSVLSDARCTRTRLTALQFLMRLRADRDHRLYIVGDVDKEVLSLAVLADRSRFVSRDKFEEADVRRTRSISRGMRRTRPGSAAASRSRSRPSPQQSQSTSSSAGPPHPKVKLQRPLWTVPESIPFDIVTTEPSSTGVTTYEENAPSEWETSKHWLPVSDYVFTLVELLKAGNVDWEILSYVLCHFPIQLSNKHFFCGPKTKEAIVSMLITLCTITLQSDAAQNIADNMPEPLRLGDAQGLIYHSLTVLISYRPNFDERKHHDMLVESFLAGLSGKLSTVKICLNALSICALELPIYISKNLPRILEKLARIMTNAAVAVHILDFVSIVGSLPYLYTNFREEEFKMVFAVAVAYIHHHNSPDTKGVSGRESFALSQHVLVVAYYIIYVWFLAVPLPERPRHVEFLARRLLLANEAKGAVDEPTEVCFDWLARYTYATADPRPAYSLLGDVVMNPSSREGGDDPEGNANNNDGGAAAEPGEAPTEPKTWLWGNSLVSIRTLPKRGWIEVVSVRPSGETKFLCKLENFPQVGPGDVDPDRVTDAAIIMSERDPLEVEKDVPDPELPQNRAATDPLALHKARGVFHSSVKSERPEDKPDPVSGYVWAQSAPSQRRKEVTIDPSYFALQLSQYPFLPKESVPSQLVTGAPQLDSFLRTLRQTPVIDTHKIGIIYVAPGQRNEKEILGNQHGSPAYTRFLENIGRLIRIRDQRDVYTGGVVPETDGEFAYAWWDDIVQVVYHTATLMPNLEFDPLRTYKKRHIGNDKVRIVWNDSGFPYDINTIPSAFNFINIIVEPHSLGTIAAFSNSPHEREFFKVTMQCMEGMPEFGPIGEYKLMSSQNLGPFLRQVSLLADFMAEVYEATDRDTSKHEYVTNWRRRLQYIDKFRSRWLNETAAGQQSQGQSHSQLQPQPSENPDGSKTGFHDIRRDFTRFF